MDETDFRILGHLFQEPLATHQQLAGYVGLTRNAVARRIRTMERSPLRLRWFAIPHPSLFGWRGHLSLFGPHDHVDAEAILSVDEVLGFDHNHDGLVPVTYYRPGRTPPPALERLLGPAHATFDVAGPGPEVAHLNRLQWKVLTAMVEAPRETAAELARRAGLGAKTVARHRQALVDTHAIRIAASVQEGAADLPIFRVFLQGQPDTAALETVVPGSMLLETTEEPTGQVRFCRAPTTAGALGAVQRLATVPGVEDVKVILPHRIEMAERRMVAWCEARRDAPKP